jgi:hypothetical protein
MTTARYTAAPIRKRLRRASVPVNHDVIPAELRALKRWVVWDYIDYGESKPRKVPVAPGKNHGLSWNVSTAWRTFDEVVREAQERGGLGIGFVFDEGDGINAVDLDDAYSDDGTLKPWAREVADKFAHTYAERTPSRNGVHFIGYGPRVVGDKSHDIVPDADAVERYSQDRWFTFTGDVIHNQAVNDVSDAMAWLASTYFANATDSYSISPASAPSDDPDFDTELARVCVEHLSNQRAYDSEDWRRVGYALKGTSESLLPVWLEFSRRWPECSDEECEDRWRRFRTRSTVGTLVQMAAEDSGQSAINLRDAARQRLGRPAWRPSSQNGIASPLANNRAVISARTHGESRDEKRQPDVEWQPFPVELLPAGVRDYVTQTAEGMASDPAMMAVPMLAALAAGIGNTRTVMVKSDWQEPAILWAAIVAESGSLKTPAMRKALQFVTEQEQEIEQRNALAIEQYEQDRVIHETRLATWKQQSRRSGDDAGLPPPPPRKPPRTSHVVSDCTIEAVAAILADNPRGVLLERDELSGWLGGFDRYKAGGAGRVSSEVGHWLSMHNASPLRLDRKSTGRVYVPRASLSIAGGIQPDTLTQAIGHEHVANGLLARFLLVAPPRRPKRFNTNMADFAAVESTRALFYTLQTIAMPEDGPITLPLTSDGEAAFRTFYERHAERQLAATGVLASMLAKIEAAAARLALIHFVCRQAGQEPTLPNAVDAESVEAGVALAEWFAQEWQRVYDTTLGGRATVDHDAELLSWIENQGGETAVREINQRMRRYRDADVLEQTITRLAKAGRLVTFSIQNERGGPPAAWVRLPPRVGMPR